MRKGIEVAGTLGLICLSLTSLCCLSGCDDDNTSPSPEEELNEGYGGESIPGDGDGEGHNGNDDAHTGGGGRSSGDGDSESGGRPNENGDGDAPDADGGAAHGDGDGDLGTGGEPPAHGDGDGDIGAGGEAPAHGDGDKACEEGTTRSGSELCGPNLGGLLQQICASGDWTDTTTCLDDDICNNGDTQSGAAPCGLNGRGNLESECVGGQWLEGGIETCDDVEECVDDSIQPGAVSCGHNARGFFDDLCVEGFWKTAGTCNDPDECAFSAAQDAPCDPEGDGEDGKVHQLCSGDGLWETLSECFQCGDGSCTASENCSTCPSECGFCSTYTTTSKVAAASDDAEEGEDGAVTLNSATLEMTFDAGTEQIVGIRFRSVDIPPGALITSAHIEFTASEANNEGTALLIFGQNDSAPPTFSALQGDISTRNLTSSSVSWAATTWGTAGALQTTPDFSAIVQELVDRETWAANQAIAIIISGSGQRIAKSYEGDIAGAPRLVVEFDAAPLCGNGVCSPTETCSSCEEDCGACPETLKIAVIGDYGWNSDPSPPMASVASLVAEWDPDHVITVGDNNYEIGAASTIDENIGQYYSEFIGNYQGVYGVGSPTNRFWPTLGNHDWSSTEIPYTDYFTLPDAAGSERYYDVDLGLVHLFALDSDPSEPDGISSTSPQAQWLETEISASSACFNIVYMHHPPYSSGMHGSSTASQWPYAAWGADAVLAGHDHHYERFSIGPSSNDSDDIPYFVNGLGGRSVRSVGSPLADSRVVFAGNYGAMLITIASGSATFEFYDIADNQQDTFTITKDCSSAPL